MHKAVMSTILCLILVCFLAACYDSREVDDWAYVYTIGIDKGVADLYRFTVQIPTEKGNTSGGDQGGSQSQGDSSFIVMSVDCPTIYAGMNMINTSLTRTLNFMHTKYIVVSEDLAKEGVEPFVNGMRRVRQIRREMHFIVVKGEASKFVKQLDPVLGVALSKMQESMMKQKDQSGLFNDTTYGNFLNDIKSTRGQPSCIYAAINDFSNLLPEGTKAKRAKGPGDYYAGELPRSGGNNFEFLGSALFDGDKMIGKLNGDETRVMLMVRGSFNRAAITINDPFEPKLYVAVEAAQQKSPRIRITFDEGNPVINIKLILEGDITQLQSEVNYEKEKLKKFLEARYEAYIKKILTETIDKCKKLNCDVFGLGEKACMQFLTIPEWEDYNWNKHFKDAEVNIEVEFTIRRTGVVFRTNPTRSTKGGE